MGVTPIHNIPFAEPTDLVRDWPALSEDVALAIEAALEDISVPQKRIEAFTGSGTWTVPAGVTYAIAHMRGGGGGIGSESAGNGGTSSVAFSSGTVDALGGTAFNATGLTLQPRSSAGQANSGNGAIYYAGGDGVFITGGGNATVSVAALDGALTVQGASVTPAASITVTVGGAGTAGTNGAAGGSGFVFIEFFEEV